MRLGDDYRYVASHDVEFPDIPSINTTRTQCNVKCEIKLDVRIQLPLETRDQVSGVRLAQSVAQHDKFQQRQHTPSSAHLSDAFPPLNAPSI